MKTLNRIGRYMEEKKKLEDMPQVEKEALCYRLLVERDKINEALRQVQKSIAENKEKV
jgi:hypothetical protein